MSILSDPFPSLLALRRRVVPPHDPEPHPDEPFAPAYDYVPLTGPRTTVAGIWRELPGTQHLPDPYGPDPVVFGRVPRV